MKAWMSSNFGQIPTPTPELSALARLKNCCLDLFYSKAKSCNLGFSIGKRENSGYFRNYCSQWPENLKMQTINSVNESN